MPRERNRERRKKESNTKKERRKNLKKEKKEGEEARARTREDSADASESDVFDTENEDAYFYLQALDGEEWPVTSSMIEEYRGVYPDLDMIAEVRTAAQWLKSNLKRETAATVDDMPGWLNGWLKDSQRDPSRRAVAQVSVSGPDPAVSRYKIDQYRRVCRQAVYSAEIDLPVKFERGEPVDEQEVRSLVKFLKRSNASERERKAAEGLELAVNEARRKATS